jgi:hypothetical protein
MLRSFSTRKIALLGFMQFIAVASMAQVKYHAKDNIQSSINGTSTLHDWTMSTSRGECKATFTLNASDRLTGLTALNFSMPAEGLKSHNSSMDKNAYKALKTKDYADITYSLTSATYAQDGTLKCEGKLTIGGATVDTQLFATAKINADKSISISGSKKLKMKDFNIVPPSFMLGTIKTGNDLTLQFDLVLTKL